MKKVYFAANAMLAHHVKSLLNNDGIPAEVTGEALSTNVGIGGTVLESKPAVWVANPEHFERALEIVREYEASRSDAPSDETWTCAECDETLGVQFVVCWSCSTERPEE